MKITLLGATGATGRLVIEQALARGDEVVAYVRSANGLAAEPGLEIITGELSDVAIMTRAMEGTGAVLVCLGTHQKKEVDLMQKAVPVIIKAMKGAAVSRLVLMSAYGVGESARTAGLIARIAYKTMVAAIYRDKLASEALLPSSGLDWTCIYPVMLTNGPLEDTVEVRPMPQVNKVRGLPKVSRANVARVMLDAARDNRFIYDRLLVTSSGSVE